MTKTKLTKRLLEVWGILQFSITVAVVAYIFFAIVLVLGDQVREPTWHSPKGCPLFVQTNK